MQKPPTQFFVYNLHTSTENLFYCWNHRPFRYVIRVDQFYFNTQMVSRNSATLPTKVCINRVWLVLHFVLTFLWKEILFFLYLILTFERETPFKPAAKGHLHYDHPMAYNSHFRGNTAYNLFLENIWKIVCSYSDANLCLMQICYL